MKKLIQGFQRNTSFRFSQVSGKLSNCNITDKLNIKKSLSMLQYNGYMMQVKQDQQKLISKEETCHDRVVKAFFTQFDDSIKVYHHSNFTVNDNPNFNYPRNSWYKVVVPLSSNQELRFRFQRFYTNFVRVGRLLELMDYIASTVAYKYVKVQHDTHVTMVTAIVDNIQFFNPIQADQDVSIQGYVTSVGSSSVEVQIDLLQQMPQSQSQKLCISAIFLMVARNSDDHKKSHQVPQLMFEGEDNIETAKLRFEIGKKSQQQRKMQATQSLLKKSPQTTEIEQLHEFFMNKNNQLGDPNSIQINDTVIEKNMLMHIQDKNLHGKIFGGHLMREAFELGWLNAYLHVKGVCYPEIFHIDDIQFLAPVEIGTTLSIQSKVTFFQDNILHCQVDCSKILPDNTKIKTNDLHLTFELSKTDNVRNVYPSTYSEGMLWLNAKRKIDHLQ